MNNEKLWQKLEKRYNSEPSKLIDVLYGLSMGIIYMASVYFLVIWRF